MNSDLIYGIICLVLAANGVILKKVYYAVPVIELKRRAEKKDKAAEKMYAIIAYGNSLKALLWLYIGLFSAASFILLARIMPIWASLLIIAPIIYIIFSLIPASQFGTYGQVVTAIANPILKFLLNLTHPFFSKNTRRITEHYNAHSHTGIYERPDLVELLDQIKKQSDSRIDESELETIKRALDFPDKSIRDIIIPVKKLLSLKSSDNIGPVLINDLHETPLKLGLVKEEDTIVGIIYFTDLNIHSTGQVKDHMTREVYFLSDDDNLTDLIDAFFKTKSRIYVVVDNFEEVIGIANLESIIEQIFGHVKANDFNEYNNIHKVASRHASQD